MVRDSLPIWANADFSGKFYLGTYRCTRTRRAVIMLSAHQQTTRCDWLLFPFPMAWAPRYCGQFRIAERVIDIDAPLSFNSAHAFAATPNHLSHLSECRCETGSYSSCCGC
jgi:hypothetical protein